MSMSSKTPTTAGKQRQRIDAVSRAANRDREQRAA
jgi:hypothetical protein